MPLTSHDVSEIELPATLEEGKYLPIQLNGIVGDMEDAVDAAYKMAPSAALPVCLDLTDAPFIEVTSLVWLIALLSTRMRDGFSTILRPPEKKKTRDFMRMWAFPQAIRSAVGLEIEMFLEPNNRAVLKADEKAGLDKTAYAGEFHNIGGVEQRLLSEGFFEITTFAPRKEKNPTQLAADQNAKWREDRILAVLNLHLRKPGRTVSSHIAHEAMMNALRHPDSRIIQTASFFDRPETYQVNERSLAPWREFFQVLNSQLAEPKANPGKRTWSYFDDDTKIDVQKAKKGIPLRKELGRAVLDSINAAVRDRNFYDQEFFERIEIPKEAKHFIERLRYLPSIEVEHCNRYILEASFPEAIRPASKGHLTILFRDDGESAINTLQTPIRQGKPIRSTKSPELHTGYEVTIEDEDGGKPKVYWSDFTPERDTREELLLFSTLLPGVTRDVTGTGHIVDPEVTRDQKILGMPGMGLFVLTTEAIDVFGGTVSIRTKNLFLTIQATHRPDNIRYAVKIRRFGAWYPPFLGNMMTVRLPLR